MAERMRRTYFVYILSSDHGVLYVGVTSDLPKRLAQHRQGSAEGFTKRYRIHRLVHFEETQDVHAALQREKQIKSWRREKKLALIRESNRTFRDLAADMDAGDGNVAPAVDEGGAAPGMDDAAPAADEAGFAPGIPRPAKQASE